MNLSNLINFIGPRKKWMQADKKTNKKTMVEVEVQVINLKS